MKGFNSPNTSWLSRSLLIAVVAAATIALGFSVIEVLSSLGSISRITVVAASLFVTVLVSRYQIRLPWVGHRISPKNLFAFWGVIWLGISGGVLLGAVASFVSNRNTADKQRRACGVAIDVVATFFSAIAFYLSLGYFASGNRLMLVGGLTVATEIVLASCVMVLMHAAQHNALVYLLQNVSPPLNAGETFGRFLVVSSTTSVASLAATVLLFVVFNHFGLEFGLVILPLAIIGDLSYKIHMRRLAQKTKLITEASRIHLATVEALATAIDARDQVGVGHVRRTQIYAVGVGNILGLGEDDINALRTGALLHDIGKLAVPDHILNKPGRLTPAEMEKMKTHSLVGASILEKVGFPYPVIPTVKYHHEFWDGRGYPEGLRGETIPLTARILSIADAFDTLRGARPYRAAVSRDEACNFLRSRAGSQFDPRLVNVFLRNLKIFETEIRAQQLVYESDREPVNLSTVIDAGASPSYVDQIKKANIEAFTLYSLARDFSSELDLDEILSLFTEKVRELVPFDTSAVYLLDDRLEFATATYVEGRHKVSLANRRIKVGEGVTGQVLLSGEPVGNCVPAADFDDSNAELTHEYRTMASIPLIAEDKIIGAISIYSAEMERYQEEHVRLLETISRIAADAIGKSLEHAVTENYALTDPMTGLANARSLQMHFDKEVKRASRSEGSFQLLVLDLDGFKAVNDTHGHKAGDRMLKEIANVIKGQLREYDFLARYGGDEFVAIVPDTDSNDGLELARRIESSVREFSMVMHEEQIARVGVSIGTACYPIHGESFDQVIVSADKAMYLNKNFNRKRNASPVLNEVTELPPRDLPIEIMEFATVTGVTKEGLILEVDETHIVSSSAVN